MKEGKMSDKKNKGIMLTQSDWQEIFYALETKKQSLQTGAYGPEDAPGQDAEWIGHLQSIQEKIGIDADLVIKNGVKPCRS